MSAHKTKYRKEAVDFFNKKYRGEIADTPHNLELGIKLIIDFIKEQNETKGV